MRQRSRVDAEPPDQSTTRVVKPQAVDSSAAQAAAGQPSARPPSTGVPRRGGYRVRIVYTEPEFQRRNPDSPSEYSGLFDCPAAHSRREAVRQALDEWDFFARHSGVSWRRLIRSVRVER